MINVIDLIDDVMDQVDETGSVPRFSDEKIDSHECHGCGKVSTKVDVWAIDQESDERVYLCEECGAW